MLFLRSDLSQAESRIVYALTHDAELLRIARSQPHEFDTHKFVGSCISGRPESEIVGQIRQAYKKIAHGCVPPFHNVLTLGRGWVRIDELSKDELIAQWNAEDQHIVFDRPKAILRFSVEEPLFHWHGRAIDIITTANHRMPFKTGAGIQVTTAEELMALKSGHLPVTGDYAGSTVVSAADARLVAAIQADARLIKANARFHLKKPRKIARLKWLCAEAGIAYSEYDCGDGTVQIGLLKAQRITEWFEYNKQYGPWLLTWNAAALDAWLDELPLWDGSIDQKSNRRLFMSSARINSEWVQTIAHLRGREGLLREQKASESSFGNKPQYIVSFNRRKYARKPVPEIVPYKGDVWCLSTLTGFFLVKHNDRISITGNSHYDEQPPRISDSLLKDGFVFTVDECALGQQRYLRRFPAIQAVYQANIRMRLIRDRRLTNSWGASIFFRYEHLDPQLYRRGYAWVPQSEIGRLLNQAGFVPVDNFLLRNNLRSRINLQVHDELCLSTCPEEAWDVLRFMHESLLIEREYEGEKLTIPVEYAIERRYHSECQTYKKLPEKDQFLEDFNKLWETRIK